MRGRISATVDPGVEVAWKKYCDEECINASKLVGRLITVHLKDKGAME